MSVYFDRPIGIQQRQSKFSNREVGITHPDVSSFMKLTDNGDIHIMADHDLGIIISKANRCIFLVGNVVKFLTNDNEGLKWNEKAFNPNATVYSEASLIPIKPKTMLYSKITNYMD